MLDEYSKTEEFTTTQTSFLVSVWGSGIFAQASYSGASTESLRANPADYHFSL